MSIKTLQNAKIRFYDSTATPFYLEVDLDPGDFTGPLGAPLCEEILELDRGNMNANALYRKGDDVALMAPVPISFSIRLTDSAQTLNIRNWLRAMNDALATQVNSHTLESTEADTQRNGANNNPAFADSNKSTCNIEYLITMTGTDMGIKYAGVWLPINEQKLSEGADAITLAISAMVYGTITDITAFTSGTDVEV